MKNKNMVIKTENIKTTDDITDDKKYFFFYEPTFLKLTDKTIKHETKKVTHLN